MRKSLSCKTKLSQNPCKLHHVNKITESNGSHLARRFPKGLGFDTGQYRNQTRLGNCTALATFRDAQVRRRGTTARWHISPQDWCLRQRVIGTKRKVTTRQPGRFLELPSFYSSSSNPQSEWPMPTELDTDESQKRYHPCLIMSCLLVELPHLPQDTPPFRQVSNHRLKIHKNDQGRSLKHHGRGGFLTKNGQSGAPPDEDVTITITITLHIQVYWLFCKRSAG